MRKTLIRFDWAIKRLLRNKANFVVLEGFLSELLFDNIKIEQILESESNQEYDDNKFNRVDILTHNSKNEIIIIEIQSSYEIDYFHRMAYGVSKTISENLNLGQKYSEIKKVISINIVYFDLGQGQDYIYRGKTEFKGLHQNDILGLSEKQKKTFAKQEVANIFPEYYLLKVNQFNDVAKDTLDEWVYFLKNNEVKDSFKAKGLKEANEVLDIMRLEKEDQYGYNRYLDSLHLKASELFSLQTEAEFNVREKEKVEIAKNGIIEGLSNELISKLTSLTIDKIQELRLEMNK
ncbi:Rpn family recombination-promoting nuclease/putative transposase [Flavobacterium branchiophilum]|uniref:Putative transposase/invertase (TIGR01784 family) n=1 Tax=Flavobacterium branchiophilum TaxID=55197 RepID=A0A543G4P9_9FLAO|nr:Rpn family recombination-promoting nuclease/putative transposase [Flavobacterium branchiophilum]TQM41066.1 putative transposase/invertase (TIGR01784 family) [Flavobacterium branchiophilum]